MTRMGKSFLAGLLSGLVALFVMASRKCDIPTDCRPDEFLPVYILIVVLWIVFYFILGGPWTD